MARIRTIKPEFFTSEDIVALPPLSRLLYIALWCEADREGRLEWKPKTFKLRYFPADDCDIAIMCEEIVGAGLVALYEVDGKTYAEIPTFKHHQVINNRESDSQIPKKPEIDQKGQDSSRVQDASLTRESGARGEGKEGRKGTRVQGAVDASSQKIWLSADGVWQSVSEVQMAAWLKAYPALSLEAELSKAAAWVLANPKNKKSNYARFLTNWFSRAQDASKHVRASPSACDPSDPNYAMEAAI